MTNIKIESLAHEDGLIPLRVGSSDPDEHYKNAVKRIAHKLARPGRYVSTVRVLMTALTSAGKLASDDAKPSRFADGKQQLAASIAAKDELLQRWTAIVSPAEQACG